MQRKDERALIHTAWLATCCVLSLFLGLATGLWTLVLVVVVVELLFWIGTLVQSQRDRRTG